MDVVVAEPGYAKVRMPVTDKVLNGRGMVHGGAFFTLADYAGALASNMCGIPTVATNCTIAFLKSAREGVLWAEAKTIKAGRRLTTQTVEVRNDAGELLAFFQGTAMRTGKTLSDAAK